MSPLTKRATVYLDPSIHKALKKRSKETERSISEVVNDAVRDALAEDAADLEAFEERENEPTLTYDEFVKELRRDGKL